jgi:3-dehydroquinate dehydratase-2
MVLGGPNLNRLGTREPEIYGSVTWAELEARCRAWADELGLAIEWLQTEDEGEMVRLVHRAGDDLDGLILNAAAYTHTSVAVRDAVAAIDGPVVEIHLSNPDAREPFRRQNLLADVVTAGIRGFGVHGYRLALEGIARFLGAGGDDSGG